MLCPRRRRRRHQDRRGPADHGRARSWRACRSRPGQSVPRPRRRPCRDHRAWLQLCADAGLPPDLAPPARPSSARGSPGSAAQPQRQAFAAAFAALRRAGACPATATPPFSASSAPRPAHCSRSGPAWSPIGAAPGGAAAVRSGWGFPGGRSRQRRLARLSARGRVSRSARRRPPSSPTAALWAVAAGHLGRDREAILDWLTNARAAEFAAMAPAVVAAASAGRPPGARRCWTRARRTSCVWPRRSSRARQRHSASAAGSPRSTAPGSRPRWPAPCCRPARQPDPIRGAWLVATGQVPAEFADVELKERNAARDLAHARGDPHRTRPGRRHAGPRRRRLRCARRRAARARPGLRRHRGARQLRPRRALSREPRRHRRRPRHRLAAAVAGDPLRGHARASSAPSSSRCRSRAPAPTSCARWRRPAPAVRSPRRSSISPTRRSRARRRTSLPQHAGPERSVAATKSVIATLTACARLVATWRQDQALLAALARAARAAARRHWPATGAPALPLLEHASRLYVVGRGPGLGIAEETALKLKETSGVLAEALSAAEIQHGPKAVIGPGFPGPGLRPGRSRRRGCPQVRGRSRRGRRAGDAGEPVAGAGRRPAPAAAAAAAPAARPDRGAPGLLPAGRGAGPKRGRDPDRPPGLLKVTRTF